MTSAPALDARVADELQRWRGIGRDLIAEHWREMEARVAEAEAHLAAGRPKEAIVAAQIAANQAVVWHCGTYASPRLERVIQRIGAALLPDEDAPPRPAAPSGQRAILHVLTEAKSVGGHARMLWRWISRDGGNTHSIALTRQTMPTPEPLLAAAAATGGRVVRVNRRAGGVLRWARELRRAIIGADLVILHVHNYDIIPFLALAGLRNRPPVALVNHCDHLFWLGVGFSDAVVNTRLSGHALCASRRGVAPERNLLMPLCLDGAERRGSRAEARRALGLDEETIVLLTVARAAKFRPIGGVTFADALVPALRAHPEARVVAIGPGGAADWAAAMRAAPGQILMHPERPDVGQFFESADIYLDSFPFPSNTSLLEAGLHGLPLVTYSPFGTECGVMGADSLGLDACLTRAVSLVEFEERLGALLSDPARRAAIGARTRAAIETTNTGDRWERALSRLYGEIDALPRVTPISAPKEAPASAAPEGPVFTAPEGPIFSDLDLFTPFVFAPDAMLTPEMRRANVTELALRTMPPVRRARILSALVRKGQITLRPRGAAWRYMLPEFLVARLRS